MHRERINLNSEKILFDWVGKQGVDAKKFAETYQSFAVQSKVQRAIQMTKAYGIDGVPALIVEGKYLTTNGMAGGDAAVRCARWPDPEGAQRASAGSEK